MSGSSASGGGPGSIGAHKHAACAHVFDLWIGVRGGVTSNFLGSNNIMDIRKWLKKNTAESTSDIDQSRNDGDNLDDRTVDITGAPVNVSVTGIAVVEASEASASNAAKGQFTPEPF